MRRFLYAIMSSLAVCGVPSACLLAATYAERIVGGFAVPTFSTHVPGDPNRLFVGRIWTGDIRVVDLLSRTILPQPFLTITGLPNPLFNEQGLLGLAFDPDYAANGYFYVNYTASDNSLNVWRYRVLGDPAVSNVADPGSGQVVINIPKNANWHNGGWIDFGPNDGYLYISTGDPGGGNAQITTGNLHGKILRIDVRSDDFPDDPMRNYAIPPSNPFVGVEGDDEIWAFGLRNPWRASFDRLTGDLWINDVGELAREEINFQPADSADGLNYGWPRREGTIAGPPFYAAPPSPEFTEPIYDYPRTGPDPLLVGTSITASGLYRGPVAAFHGHYLFADFGSGNIWKLDPDAIDPRASVTNINHQLLPDVGFINRIASSGEDAAGNLYLMEFDGPNGEVYRVATTSRDAVWNGNDAAEGAPGDGTSWLDSRNWTRGTIRDASFESHDQVIFTAGSSEPVINLQDDRSVAAVTFEAPCALEDHTLKVLSGNVTVDDGVIAVIRSDLVAETANHSIRKLGDGTLLIEGSAGQVSVKAGTLGGSGTVDHLTVRSGGTVAPGASTGILTVDQSFTMHEAATLAIEIGGRDNFDSQSPQYDQLLIGGIAQLRGALIVAFADLGNGIFTPAVGDSFSILAANGGIMGAFDMIQLPQLPRNFVWSQVSDETTWRLAVAPALPGDYNGNGSVDATDYVVWRKSLGEADGNLAADGSGPSGSPDGVIDEFDYQFWRANFGKTLSEAASPLSVPEPHPFCMALLFGMTLSMTRAANRYGATSILASTTLAIRADVSSRWARV